MSCVGQEKHINPCPFSILGLQPVLAKGDCYWHHPGLSAGVILCPSLTENSFLIYSLLVGRRNSVGLSLLPFVLAWWGSWDFSFEGITWEKKSLLATQTRDNQWLCLVERKEAEAPTLPQQLYPRLVCSAVLHWWWGLCPGSGRGCLPLLYANMNTNLPMCV